MCDTYTPQGEPIPTNKRHRAAEIFSNKKVVDEVPWYVFLSCLGFTTMLVSTRQSFVIFFPFNKSTCAGFEVEFMYFVINMWLGLDVLILCDLLT